MAGPYRVDLLKEYTSIESGSAGYQLDVTASDPLNMSEKVFTYRRTTDDNDIFEGVCTPSQLTLLPADDPDTEYEDDPTRFRLDTYSRIFTDPDDIEEAWGELYSAVKELVKSMNLIDTYQASVQYRVGETSVSHTTSVYVSA